MHICKEFPRFNAEEYLLKNLKQKIKTNEYSITEYVESYFDYNDSATDDKYLEFCKL